MHFVASRNKEVAVQTPLRLQGAKANAKKHQPKLIWDHDCKYNYLISSNIQKKT
jgi:hypothetical protein